MQALSIRNLSGLSVAVLTNTFNQAFSDYLVPVQLTTVQMQLKMQQEQIDPAWSAGAFHGDELVALILHGYRANEGRKLLYNAGTGVVPGWRGRGLTHALYQWFLPQAKSAGIARISLEAICTNERAIHVYEKIGFRRQRHFNLWKGAIPEAYCKQPLVFDTPLAMEWIQVMPWWTAAPCWSASPEAVDALGADVLKLIARIGHEVAGYCAVARHSGRLLQLCVAPPYRKQGIGSALLAEACKRLMREELLALNVDKSDTATNRFFENRHWQRMLQQYEMSLTLQDC
ncbi:MAG: GNAT family N-acetyltransferase [Chitinophagaceae bacterium]|jgi:ribosomal protein S18 acetylase RimI-like enzyme|nr:GNAT family N-acetyltransferase [Chitinophagaceae bacterium]